MTDDDLNKLSSEIGQRLQSLKATMTTAESCTGGWIAKVITDIPGSSCWFERGFVTYSNQSKQEMVGVTPDSLTQYGAVSEQVVREMAEGARAAAGLTFPFLSVGSPDLMAVRKRNLWVRSGSALQQQIKKRLRSVRFFLAIARLSDVRQRPGAC